jgi:hypothetical protein
MRYVLLIYGDETWMEGLSEDEQRAHMVRWGEYDVAMREAGIAVAGEALDRTANARTVRSRGRHVTLSIPGRAVRHRIGGRRTAPPRTRRMECATCSSSTATSRRTGR